MRWVESWLCDRTLSVTVNGATSSQYPVTSGVPQGSVLGPLLFLAYINDMPDIVTSGKLRLFADDYLLYKHIHSSSDSALLQADLNNLCTWADDWQMKFNVSKCEQMRIARPANQVPSCSYLMNNTPLQDVTEVKYLGVKIDNTLSFNNHITEICRKATGTLHMLMRSLKRAKTKTRTVAFNTICRPILEYASQCWCPHKQKHITQLETINRKAFRWAYFKKKFDHISDDMCDLGWSTLAARRQRADLRLYARVITGRAAIDEELISTHQNPIHNTRTGSIHGTINTNVQKFSYRQRLYALLNPIAPHRSSDL